MHLHCILLRNSCEYSLQKITVQFFPSLQPFDWRVPQSICLRLWYFPGQINQTIVAVYFVLRVRCYFCRHSHLMQWHSHTVCTEIGAKSHTKKKNHPFAHISVAAIQTVHMFLFLSAHSPPSLYSYRCSCFHSHFSLFFLGLISAGGLNLRQLILL